MSLYMVSAKARGRCGLAVAIGPFMSSEKMVK